MTGRTEPSDLPPDSNVFRLDEYGRAGQAFVADAIRAVASANSPILAMIAVEKVEAIAVSRSTLDDGQILDHEPHKVESTLTMSISDGIAGNFDDLHLAIAKMADEYAAQLVPSMLSCPSCPTSAKPPGMWLAARDDPSGTRISSHSKRSRCPSSRTAP